MRRLGIVVVMGLSLVACGSGSAKADSSLYTEQGVTDYLASHPGQIEPIFRSSKVQQAFEQLMEKQQLAIQKQQQSTITQNIATFIAKGDNNIVQVIGDPQKATNIVEFYDYSCPHCSRANNAMIKLKKQLSNEGKSVRVIYKPVAILNSNSMQAARIAIAGNTLNPNTFSTLNTMIFNNIRDLTKAINANVTKDKYGYDAKTLLQKADATDVNDAVNDNIKQFETTGLRGVPGFIFVSSDLKKVSVAGGGLTVTAMEAEMKKVG